MNETFLENFMRVAKKITHAERCLVVNADLEILSMSNVDEAEIESADFNELAMECLREALDTGEAVITNNVITDPSEAPTTNTNFANLRVVVALPLAGHGAVYLDQHIRNGIIPRQMIERLMRLAAYVLDNQQENCSETELTKLYQQIN